MNPDNKPKPLKIPDFTKKVETNAEQQKPVTQRILVKKIVKRPIDYIMQGIVFLVLSILVLVAVYYVFNYSEDFLLSGEKATEKKLVFENPLVRADRSRVVSLEAGATKESVRSVITQALINEHVNKGEVSLVMPSYLRDTVVNNERKLVSEPQRGDDFFFTFAPRAPLNLKTISAEKYAIGIAGVDELAQDGNKRFFVFSVSSAPDATRELLRYESQIYTDMKPLLELREIKGSFYFKDLSYNNHLLRVGYDDSGVVLVYGFGAPKTVIIAPSPETFEMVYSYLK